MTSMSPVCLAFLFGALVAVTALAGQQAESGALSERFVNWADHPTIQYRGQPASDPVATLIRKVDAGEVRLQSDGTSGFLRSLLAALEIPVDSQIMVFARDSVQALRINSQNPRALFFNDSVAVGWVRGGFIEIASQDPRQGVVFYTLESTLSSLRRRSDCLSCHQSYGSLGIPGMLDRSAAQFTVTHRVPFADRWGGWYVTGQHGSARHLGNTDMAHVFDTPATNDTSNWPSLDGKVDTSGYPAAQSDIAALLVFEHQMHMMNLLTRIGWEARVTDYRLTHSISRASSDGDDGSEQPTSMEDAAREVVDYMLFVDEAPLPQAIQGPTTFAARFSANGPHDRQGRSLRQLDLRTRLLRYPCSYLIYSDQFEQLPARARSAIYQQLWQILSGQAHETPSGRLALADRAAIIEILRDTKPDLPTYFRPLSTIARP
jgi:hypothetical protein